MRLWHIHRKCGCEEYTAPLGMIVRAKSPQQALQMVLNNVETKWHESWRAGSCEELTASGPVAFIMEELLPSF